MIGSPFSSTFSIPVPHSIMPTHRTKTETHASSVLSLTFAERVDRGVVGLPFGAAVPAQVVVVAVAVLFAVRVVVLVVVADEIHQREPVVRGDEVDARVRLTAALRIQIVAAGQARRQL